MRRVAFSLVLLIVGAVPSFAQDWIPLPPLPQARYGSAGAALSGSFYVLGGSSGSDLSSMTVWTEAGGWTSASPMSTTRQFPGAASLGSFVYAVGGLSSIGSPHNTVERFDPALNTWNSVAPLPMPRALMSVATWGGSMFVLGGEGVFGALTGESFRYDPAGDVWSQTAPIPTPCSGPGAAVMGNEIYVVGGSSMSILATVQIYDPAADTWRMGPDLPEPLWIPAVASFEGRIWVMGGFDQFFGRSDRVYSLGSDAAWQTESALPQGLASSAVGSSGSRIVLAGGMNSSGQPVSASVTRVGAAPPPPPPPPAVDPLRVQAEFNPHTLNVSSRGNWVSVKLWAPDWNVSAVDAASVRVGGVAADPGVEPSIGTCDGVPCLTVKLPRAGFADLADGNHVLAVEATTHEGDPVRGQAEVRVGGADPKKKVAHTPGPELKPVRTGRTTSTVQLSLSAPARVRIDIVDIQGRRVDQVADQVFAAGEHVIEWPGVHRANPGMYFVRARLEGVVLTSRMTVLH